MPSDYSTVLASLSETTREARRLEVSLRETEAALARERALHRLTVRNLTEFLNSVFDGEDLLSLLDECGA